MKDVAVILGILLEVFDLIRKAFAGHKPSVDALNKLLKSKQLKSELAKSLAHAKVEERFGKKTTK